MTTTICGLLAGGADQAAAIGAPGRSALDFAGLRVLVQRTVARLNAMGIGRDDRVAIVRKMKSGRGTALALRALLVLFGLLLVGSLGPLSSVGWSSTLCRARTVISP